MTEPRDLRPGQQRITNLRTLPESIDLWGVDTSRLSTTWTVTESNIGLKSGSPLGSITYTHNTTARQLTVAVRWNFFRGELYCGIMTGRADADEQVEVERDARHRVGALVAAYADLGSRTGPRDEDMGRVAGLTVGELAYGGAAITIDERASDSIHDVDAARIADLGEARRLTLRRAFRWDRAGLFYFGRRWGVTTLTVSSEELAAITAGRELVATSGSEYLILVRRKSRSN